jgi:hypothetical protein
MRRVTKLSGLLALACAAIPLSAQAATDAEIDAAIQNGLAYFQSSQLANGSWAYGGYEPAATGAAAYAMLTQSGVWGGNAAAYQTVVDNAINYLLANATKTTVSTQNDGTNICPGGGSCAGVFWNAAGNEDSYTTGLIAPAIALYAAGNAGAVATTTGPLANMTWGEISQGMTNLWAASQATANQGNRQGGWRYILGAGGYDADMSTTQWGIVSLLYDQTLGATTPGIVRTDLATWLAAVQSANGSACYQPGSQPCDHADTGGMMLGLDLIGKSASDPAVQDALDFLNANWTDTASSTWYGNFGQPYAMWSVYKGLESTIGLANTTEITNLRPGNCGNDRGADCNWWQDYNEYLVSTQLANGSWAGYSYWTGTLATAFYLPILGGTQLPPPPMPEPATLGLFAIGLIGLAAALRRRKS